MTQKITVHRALALIKKTKEELEEVIDQGLFVDCVKGSSNIPVNSSFKSQQELQSHLQSNTDKVVSSFNLIAVLKEAIMKSNLETYVDFLGQPTSIAKILVYKESLNLKQAYLSTLQQQVTRAQSLINLNESSKIIPQLDQITASTSSVADKELLQKNILSLYSIQMITGYSTKTPSQLISELKNEVMFLSSEINTVLSETNVTTLIEVDI